MHVHGEVSLLRCVIKSCKFLWLVHNPSLSFQLSSQHCPSVWWMYKFVTLWILEVNFDESSPIFGNDVQSDIKWIWVCCAKGEFHLSKSLQASFPRLMPIDVLEFIVEANGNVKAFEEPSCDIYLLLSQDLSEMKVIYWDCILSPIWIAHMCYMWECSSECFKVKDFPWGGPDPCETFVGTMNLH